jgi:hypothetical protein
MSSGITTLPASDALMEAARAASGLAEFGDLGFVERLDRYLDALSREARLSETGVQAEQGQLTRLLINRLRVHDALTRNPDAAKETVTDPVVIIGMPRSGTTKLHRLLARDDGFQILPLWKILNPVPLAPEGEPDPRVGMAEEFVGMLHELSPTFAAAHPMDAREPDEEEFLMEQVFLSFAAFYLARVPSYQEWALAQDFDPWYSELHQILQYLQYSDGTSGKPWLLKAPSHTGHMDKIFEYFPNATVVHIHRDAQSTVPSLCGLIRAARGLYSDRIDLPELGDWALDHWPTQFDIYIEQRGRWESAGKTFIDVAYPDLVADAMPIAEDIYDRSGRPLTDDARAQMQAWQDDNPQHKHGRHRYELDEYGLTTARIDNAFATYRERFKEIAW